MAKINSAAGLETPLQPVFPQPITSSRSPTGNDKNYPIGQIWVNKAAGAFFGLSRVLAGVADWEDLGGSSSTLNSLTGDSGTATPSGSNILIAGTTNITTSGAGSTISVAMDGAITLATSVTTPLIIGSAPGSIAIQLGDIAGVEAISITDSATTAVWTVNSLGDMNASGLNHTLGNATGNSTIQIGPGVGSNVTSINNGINTGVNTTNINSGNPAADSIVNILTGTSTAGTQTFNLMTGTSPGQVNIATGTTTHSVAIGSGNAGPIGIDSVDSIALTSFFSNPLAINLIAFDPAGGITLKAGSAHTNIDSNLNFVSTGNKLLSANVATTTTAGANSFGTVVLVAGTATVSTTSVTAGSLIVTWRQDIGATGAAAIGMITAGTIAAGVSFVINSVTEADATSVVATDVSTIGWMLIN